MVEARVPVSLGSSRARRRAVPGFDVAQLRFLPGLRLAMHCHERATIAVVLRGAFEGLNGSTSHDCRVGTVITEPAGEPHGNRFAGAGADVFVIQPEPNEQMLEPFARLLSIGGCHPDLHLTTLARKASIELRASDAAAGLALEGVVLEFLASVVRARQRADDRHEQPTPGWLSQTLALLHDQRHEQLTVAGIAHLVGVHPAYLARNFRQRYGLPLGAYQRRLRLEWAAGRLARTDDPLGAVAQAAGFFDQSHFTRSFRQLYGVTPGGYRRSVRG
jgi:AraC family transcriptional regulator